MSKHKNAVQRRQGYSSLRRCAVCTVKIPPKRMPPLCDVCAEQLAQATREEAMPAT